jgi:hypothetical protein
LRVISPKNKGRSRPNHACIIHDDALSNPYARSITESDAARFLHAQLRLARKGKFHGDGKARRWGNLTGIDAAGVRAKQHSDFNLPRKGLGNRIHARSTEMRSAFILSAIGTVLLGSASIANAQQTQQNAPPSARAKMVEDANMSVQSITDVSYGGVPDTRSETGSAQTGGVRSPPCAGRTRCDLFSRH